MDQSFRQGKEYGNLYQRSSKVEGFKLVVMSHGIIAVMGGLFSDGVQECQEQGVSWNHHGPQKQGYVVLTFSFGVELRGYSTGLNGHQVASNPIDDGLKQSQIKTRQLPKLYVVRIPETMKCWETRRWPN